MLFPNNFLRYYLRNVYFFCGTACGGKTTVSRAFAERHGFQWLSEDEINDNYQALALPGYQPAQFDRPADWTDYFLRPAEEYAAWLERIAEEQAPLALLEAIRLAADRPVVVDSAMPVRTALAVCPADRLIFLATDPERAARDNAAGRPDHQALTNFIETLPRAEEIKQNIYHLFVHVNTLRLNEIQQSGAFYLMRDDGSTVEGVLALAEQHFGM